MTNRSWRVDETHLRVAGYSWDRSPELRTRLLAAMDHIRAPVFVIHAANDYSVNPGKVLDARLAQFWQAASLENLSWQLGIVAGAALGLIGTRLWLANPNFRIGDGSDKLCKMPRPSLRVCRAKLRSLPL